MRTQDGLLMARRLLDNACKGRYVPSGELSAEFSDTTTLTLSLGCRNRSMVAVYGYRDRADAFSCAVRMEANPRDFQRIF